MRVALYKLAPERTLIAEGVLAVNGQLNASALGATMAIGEYEAVFHIAQWYREQSVALPTMPFLDVVYYRFGIDNPEQHYHLPFKCTPWGYSCFRGGA
jgi:5-hydroxyisourate hydrolase